MTNTFLLKKYVPNKDVFLLLYDVKFNKEFSIFLLGFIRTFPVSDYYKSVEVLVVAFFTVYPCGFFVFLSNARREENLERGFWFW